MKTKKTEAKPTHTPGPWQMYPDPKFDNSFNIWTSDGKSAHEGGIICGEPLPAGDASLISAAPEVLSAAKLVMEWADSPDVNNNQQRTVSISALRAAIAKAEGR